MMRGEESSHDRLLWVNVLLRAIEDATALDWQRKDAYWQRQADEARTEARAWFDLANPDFLEVCNLAGRDPEDTYKKAMAAIQQADQRPVPDRKPAREETHRVKTYTHNGLTLTVDQWAKHTGIPRGVLHHRLKSPNYTVEQALTAPYQPRSSKGSPFDFTNFGRTLPA